MPQYTVKGIDRDSGFDTEVVVEADSEAQVRAEAGARGILIKEVIGPVLTPTQPKTQPQRAKRNLKACPDCHGELS